jgi:hypothetical protein
MTKAAIVELGDLTLRVSYELSPTDVILYNSVRVVGQDYAATGPNLVSALDDMYYIVGGVGQPVLAALQTKLLEDHHG